MIILFLNTNIKNLSLKDNCKKKDEKTISITNTFYGFKCLFSK